MTKISVLTAWMIGFSLLGMGQEEDISPLFLDTLVQITELPHQEIEPAVGVFMQKNAALQEEELAESYYGAIQDKGFEFFSTGEGEKAVPYFLVATGILTHKSAPQLGRKGHVYFNIGSTLLEAGRLKKAEQFFYEAIDLLTTYGITQESPAAKSKFEWVLGNCHYQLAVMYKAALDYDRGLRHCEDALASYNTSEDSANVFLCKGALYANLYQPTAAIAAYTSAQQRYGQLKIPHEEVKCFQNLAEVYQQLEQWDAAVESCKKGFELFQQLDTTDATLKAVLAQLYIERGIALKHLNTYPKAQQDFATALALSRQLGHQSPSPQLAQIYDNQGDVYCLEGQMDKGLALYRQAILQLIPDFDKENILNSPAKLDTLPILGSSASLLIYLTDRAKALAQFPDSLDQAIKLYQLADRVIFRMRKSHRALESKLFWIKHTRPFYEHAIQLCLLQNQLPLAFEFLGRSKSSLLLAAVREARAKEKAPPPLSKLAQEQVFKDSIAHYENALTASYLTQQANVPQTATYRHKLRKWRSQFALFIDQLEDEHVLYYQYKHLNTVASLDAIQAYLHSSGGDTTALLEYFEGDSSIWLFYVDHKTAVAREFPKTPALYKIFLQAVSAHPEQDTAYASYRATAYQMYQYLLGSLGEITLPRNLIIVPDGSLANIPFEALLKEPTLDDNGIMEHAMLVHHRCSYAFSASILLHSTARGGEFWQNVLGVAPVNFGLGHVPLPGSEAAVEDIVKLLGGETLIGPAATKRKFIEMAAQPFQVLHLYTHAEANEIQPFIVLSGDSLWLSDIYAMYTRASLVVLGACETIRGETKKGEGVMSLARGFRYIGVSSVVASLWKCPDQATEQILGVFYKNLKNGLAKDEALYQAKLTYLSQTGRPEPFYWAAFIHVGDPTPMTFLSIWMKYWKWLLVALATIGIRIFWKKLNQFLPQ